MNANSPTLTESWTKFFIGFDNIAEHVAAGNTDNFKVGVVPGTGTSDTCIMDTNDVRPPESPSRVLPRKQRRKALRQALHEQRLAASSTGVGNGKSNFDQTVFIATFLTQDSNQGTSFGFKPLDTSALLNKQFGQLGRVGRKLGRRQINI